ncbi:hypothetical protein [Brachybacterium hainanense]|uniref:Uncharacterized protein n=1 Tax=Brachybacterium hainanense TaxID=1541174 RepID=A0ABV6RE17_9MICO
MTQDPVGGDLEGAVVDIEFEPAVFVRADSFEEAERILADADGVSAQSSSGDVVRYGPCLLEAQGTHLRQSGNCSTVGFKAYTKRTVPVTSISHTLYLREKRLLTWKKVTPTVGGSNKNYGASSLKSIGMSYTCTSKTTKRWWSGAVQGKMVYKGKEYYATAYARVTSDIVPCSS